MDKDQIFVGFVVLAVAGGVMTAIFSDPSPYIKLSQTFLFVVVMYAVFYKIPYTFNKINAILYARSTSPKILRWFELQNENELVLYIKNPENAKEIYVECALSAYQDMRGRNYIVEYRHELKLVTNSYRSEHRIFSDTLQRNDTRIVRLSIDHNGKVALRSADNYAIGWRDGMYEYKLSFAGNYMGNSYKLDDLSIWITIKDGVLVKASKSL